MVPDIDYSTNYMKESSFIRSCFNTGNDYMGLAHPEAKLVGAIECFHGGLGPFMLLVFGDESSSLIADCYLDDFTTCLGILG